MFKQEKICYTVTVNGMADFSFAKSNGKESDMSDRAREGDLYKRVTAFGKTFDLYYGYYEEFEREHSEPIPIYPDFFADPQYTEEGHPFATQMQDMCDHGAFREAHLQDQCCGNCSYFKSGEDLFGICTCQTNRRNEIILSPTNGGNQDEKKL